MALIPGVDAALPCASWARHLLSIAALWRRSKGKGADSKTSSSSGGPSLEDDLGEEVVRVAACLRCLGLPSWCAPAACLWPARHHGSCSIGQRYVAEHAAAAGRSPPVPDPVEGPRVAVICEDKCGMLYGHGAASYR